MGTKIDTETVEGMRKIVHDSIDRTFNAMEKDPAGKPVDTVEFQHELHTYRTEGGAFLAEGMTVSLRVKYVHPQLRVSPNTEMFVRTGEGLFRLVDPSEPRINHLVQILIGLHAVDHEAGALDTIVEGREFEVSTHISALAQISALMFERVEEKQAAPPEPAPEVEPVPDGEPKDTEKTEPTAEELAETEAKQRYEDALARGLSDAEAREEGWPTEKKTEE